MDGIEITLFLRICGAAVLTATVGAVLHEVSRGARLPVKAVGAAVLYGGILLLLIPLVERLKALSAGYALAEYAEIMLKCLGIALLSQIVSDLCRDIGEGSIASLVEMAGKTVILLLAFPLIESLLGTVDGLL